MVKSVIQKQVLSLYKSFMKTARLKPIENQEEIKKVIREKFYQNISMPKYARFVENSFDSI